MSYYLPQFILIVILVALHLISLFMFERIEKKISNSRRNEFRRLYINSTTALFGTMYITFLVSFVINIWIMMAVELVLLSLFVMVCKDIIQSIIKGIIIDIDGKLKVNSEVVINGEYSGTIKELSLLNLKLFQGANSTITLNYNKIDSFETIHEGITTVKSEIVLSHRQDPEKAEEVLITLTDKLNKKFKEMLEAEGNKIGDFKYLGITDINDESGIKYAIGATVHTDSAVEIKEKMDRELSITLFKSKLLKGEKNVFFKTRTEK